MQALGEEIRERAAENAAFSVRSVFIGGGTPTLLEAAQITQLMETVRVYYDLEKDAEITIEANPCTLNMEKLAAYRKGGINRISIGAQSVFDKQLQTLGRLHDAKTFFQALGDAKKAGFSNINVDLMFGLPEQTCEMWRETLRRVAEEDIPHISAYSLIIEEGTPFEKVWEQLNLPSEDDLARMYADTADILSQYGLQRYEISNYALPGKESVHNCGYWTGVRYEGFGLGASSYEGRSRFYNTKNFEEYLSGAKHPVSLRREESVLPDAERMEEFMILGLRMTKGIKEADFRERFGKDLFSVYGKVLRKHLNAGTLEAENGRIFIPEKYLFVSNSIMTDFME